MAKGNPAIGTVAAVRAVAPARVAKPAQVGGGAAAAPMLATMQQELDREMGILGKADPPAYFLGYTVTDSNHATVTGSNGALLR